MPSIWLRGGLRWLCPAFRDWMLDARCWMSDVPDREPSRFAAGRNGLGCWTFWRLPALVAAANQDGSRSDPEPDAALPRYGAHLDTGTGRFSLSPPAKRGERVGERGIKARAAEGAGVR